MWRIKLALTSIGYVFLIHILHVKANPLANDEKFRNRVRRPAIDGFAQDDTKTPVHQNQCAQMMKDYQPTLPSVSLSGNTVSSNTNSEYSISIQGGLPAATCVNGLASTVNGNYPCEKVDLMSFVSLAQLNTAYGTATDQGNDVWGWTDLPSGREFAMMGLYRGVAFVEVTDPLNPIYKGVLPHQNLVGSSWSDIKTYNNHAFIVSEAAGHGMQVFDLRQLLTSGNNVRFSASAHYSAFGNAHNIAINEASGHAYAVGSNTCSGGLHMINIQNPTIPTNAGCFSADGYTHDAHCVIYQGPHIFYQGREICFACNEDTITIVDVTIKSSPTQISRVTYSNSRYTHQGWLTEDHRYFIFGDELDEQKLAVSTTTFILNVETLTSPQMKYVHRGTTTAIDHNQYVVGDFIFQANYRAGFQMLNFQNLSTSTPTIKQVAFFDIYPASNSNSFNGAWSVYPFFSSGNILVSGIEQGLFILKPNLVATPTDSPSRSPSRAPVPKPVIVLITYDDFELGFGSFVDGGTLAYRGSGANCPNGTYCAVITGRLGVNSSIYQSKAYGIVNYSDLVLQFTYRAISMDSTLEGFVLEVNWDEKGWTIIGDYRRGTAFANGTLKQVSITLPVLSRLTVRFRFRCEASDSKDYVYIDNVRLEGKNK